MKVNAWNSEKIMYGRSVTVSRSVSTFTHSLTQRSALAMGVLEENQYNASKKYCTFYGEEEGFSDTD